MGTKTKDRWSSLFWLIFAVGFCFASLQLPFGTLYQSGPGFFPFLAGGILALLSLLNFFQAKKGQATTEKKGPLPGEINYRSILLTLAILAAFPFLLGFLGFGLTTFVFFVLLLRFIEPQGWPVTLGGAGLFAVLAYFVFQVWLKIKFPLGLLGT